jgi:eukaryotic-like serine/threonine-protein kinase
MANEEPTPTVPNAEDLTGIQLGGFRILRRLGSGAMADVYLADQSSLRRQVAVKVLKRHLATDQTYVKRFEREAQAAASLVHANIVQIYEVGYSGQSYYIAQEYVQGLNLRQWLERNGAPDLRLALVIMRQVAAALAKAGQQGIVHRDVKPENIMLTRTGEVKVADFGLARVAQDGEQASLTEVGMTMGTPLYMSPEQVEGRALDPRSDIYSFGVTCYQMLAGCSPFSGDTALSIALQHLRKQPDPLENHRPDLPAALCRLVHRMLAKSPEHRFQSALELLGELRRVQVTYLGESWPEELPDSGIPGTEAAAAPHEEATRHLGELMRTVSQATVRRPRWGLWTLGSLVAFLLGGLLALAATYERPLLAGVEKSTRSVPQQATVVRQWFLARWTGTPEAWQSVIDYFPADTYWVNHAKQQLALIYLREEDRDRALAIFEELASLDESETELRAFGLAGEAGVLTMNGEYRKSAVVIDQLLPIVDKLDPQMRQMLSYALRTNKSKLGAPTKAQWQDWLKEHFPDAG